MPNTKGSKADSLKTYLLRDVPSDVWRKARARAAIEDRTIREVLIEFLQTYAAGKTKG